MEKKTMGAFIATMRKAKGMTQLQLADRLGVSNKTISHWECDESAPDLSLLPELANILGITCDELIRGELNTIERNSNIVISDKVDDAIDEEKKIKREKTHLNTSFIISVGLEVLAALAALLIPYIESFALAYLVSGVLLVVSSVVSLIALNKATNNVSVYKNQVANNFKNYIRKIRFAVISMVIVGILFCFVYQYLNFVVSGAFIVISVLAYFIKFRKSYTKKCKSPEKENEAE